MLRSDLCDYSDAYIVVKGTIDFLSTAANEDNKEEKEAAFKNNVPVGLCISKINNTLIDNVGNFNIVISMYNLSEYGHSYSMTSGSFLNYHRGEIDEVDYNFSDDKLFEYITKIVGKTPNRLQQAGNLGDAYQPLQPPRPPLNTEANVPLQYLCTFWRSLNLPLSNYEGELGLPWTKSCVLIEHQNNIKDIDFKTTITKLYISLVTLSISDNITFLARI